MHSPEINSKVKSKMMYLAASPNDVVFKNNSMVGEGILTSISYLRFLDPNLSGAVSEYEARTSEKDKEEAFEKIRKKNYPDQPSRKGAIFLFPDFPTANRANEIWWSNQRELYEATIVEGFKVLRADSKWLNCTPGNYIQNAHNYFTGILSPDPIMEIVLMGSIKVCLKPIPTQSTASAD